MVTAYVLLVTGAGEERRILKDLMERREVKEGYVVYGEYDIILKVEADNLRELDQFISEEIRESSPIQMTSTLISVED